MTNERFLRTEMLIGRSAVDALSTKKVAVFGLGGVGSYAAEAIARSGVGSVELIDADTVSVSNINRQLCALESTVGKAKVDVVASRIADIDPNIKIVTRCEFFMPENSANFDFASYDFVIDAIDTVAAKVEIVKRCSELSIPMISCMGTGNKLDPTKLKVTDLSKTSGCPLARVMRRELKAIGITHLPVVYSEEAPIQPQCEAPDGKRAVGSVAFVPSVAGLIAASEAIKALIKNS
jgi:tRNA A37 threonylcarbamoyladenosine dehydratase